MTDQWIASSVLVLAIWILLSGLDDLALDAVAFWAWVRGRRLAETAAGDVLASSNSRDEKRVAIFLPLWQEDGVAGAMIEHSIAAIRYGNYVIFAGCYPNDAPTFAALRQAAHRFPNVRIALCPHDGPTSKADCLDWIYERMQAEERERRIRFDIVLIHDAEDVIHPDALSLANYYCEAHDMVQLAVLPLSTPLVKLTHGIYCDEFAESHGKDLPVRQRLGGFIPSAGVGTAYTRRAIDLLAASGELFDRACLTEDYLNGLRLRQAGCKQLFLRFRSRNGIPLATREYFPQTVRQAIRQRTRWVAGISLQTWATHGWGRCLSERYWFWRDRKGLVGNPVSLLSNLTFVYGAITGLWSVGSGTTWGLARAMPHPLADWLLAATLALLVLRSGIRAGCSASVYGWRFAAAVPLRAVWANWINGSACIFALAQYAAARVQRRRLVWLKTEHTYPPACALLSLRRPLGEILGSMHRLRPDEVRSALERADGLRIGEYLVRSGRLTEEDVYSALSVQQGIPFGRADLAQAPEWVRGLLPEDVIRKWKVAPYKVGFGTLFVAGPEVPSPGMEEELSRLTGLHVRFELITPKEYERAWPGRARAASAAGEDA